MYGDPEGVPMYAEPFTEADRPLVNLAFGVAKAAWQSLAYARQEWLCAEVQRRTDAGLPIDWHEVGALFGMAPQTARNTWFTRKPLGRLR